MDTYLHCKHCAPSIPYTYRLIFPSPVCQSPTPRITSSGSFGLLVRLTDWDGQEYEAHYDSFQVVKINQFSVVYSLFDWWSTKFKNLSSPSLRNYEIWTSLNRTRLPKRPTVNVMSLKLSCWSYFNYALNILWTPDTLQVPKPLRIIWIMVF